MCHSLQIFSRRAGNPPPFAAKESFKETSLDFFPEKRYNGMSSDYPTK